MQDTMFTKEFIMSAAEIIYDKSLNDEDKISELREMLLDEGYETDDLVDLLLALHPITSRI